MSVLTPLLQPKTTANGNEAVGAQFTGTSGDRRSYVSQTVQPKIPVQIAQDKQFATNAPCLAKVLNNLARRIEVVRHLGCDDYVEASIGKRQMLNRGDHAPVSIVKIKCAWPKIEIGNFPCPTALCCPCRQLSAKRTVPGPQVEDCQLATPLCSEGTRDQMLKGMRELKERIYATKLAEVCGYLLRRAVRRIRIFGLRAALA